MRLCGVVYIPVEEVLHQVLVSLLVCWLQVRVKTAVEHEHVQATLTYPCANWEVFVASQQLAHPVVQKRGSTDKDR